PRGFPRSQERAATAAREFSGRPRQPQQRKKGGRTMMPEGNSSLPPFGVGTMDATSSYDWFAFYARRRAELALERARRTPAEPEKQPAKPIAAVQSPAPITAVQSPQVEKAITSKERRFREFLGLTDEDFEKYGKEV